MIKAAVSLCFAETKYMEKKSWCIAVNNNVNGTHLGTDLFVFIFFDGGKWEERRIERENIYQSLTWPVFLFLSSAVEGVIWFLHTLPALPTIFSILH